MCIREMTVLEGGTCVLEKRVYVRGVCIREVCV